MSLDRDILRHLFKTMHLSETTFLTRTLITPPVGLERLRTRLLILGFWIGLASLETAKEVTTARLHDAPRTITDALIVNFPWWFFWFFGSLVAILLVQRWPLEPGRIGRALLRHAVAALLLVTVHLTLVGVLVYFTITRGGATAGADIVVQIRFWLEGYGVLDYFVYWMVLGAYHALIFQQRYVAGAVREAEARTRAARFESAAVSARMRALQMELNPHFLFNSLNAVAALIDEARGREAKTVIARLARLLRLTLHRGQVQEVEVDSELEYIELYLSMEQIRCGPRLQYEIAADDDVLRALVPPMILQPLVENAVLHGAARVAGPARITVSATHTNGVLRIDVTDDGAGLLSRDASGSHSGTGLTNVRERLQTLYGPRANLIVQPQPSGRGVRASIELPFRSAGALIPEQTVLT